jgi:glycosyltransferase involved in cell wall biosynthesis
VEEVLQAASLLKAEGCPILIRMVAVPPSLSERIVASDVANMIQVEGPASHARVLALMAETEIFLLPSRGEGFPNSLVEAMAAGMASIATPVGAVPKMAAYRSCRLGMVLPWRARLPNWSARPSYGGNSASVRKEQCKCVTWQRSRWANWA